MFLVIGSRLRASSILGRVTDFQYIEEWSVNFLNQK